MQAIVFVVSKRILPFLLTLGVSALSMAAKTESALNVSVKVANACEIRAQDMRCVTAKGIQTYAFNKTTQGVFKVSKTSDKITLSF